MRQLRERHPKTARVLVGSSQDKEQFSDLMWLTHAFVPHQFSRILMKTTLTRVFVIQDMLADAAIAELFAHLERLPSERTVWNQLITLTSRPGTSALEIAKVVEGDAAATAKVLQLVNSAFFGLGRRVTSIHQSVCYIGLAQLRALAVTAQLYTSFGEAFTRSLSVVSKLHRHAVLVGRLAKQMLRDPQQGDDAMAAGLLHDIGKLALLLGVPRQQTTPPPDALLSNDDIHGVKHAWLGAHMARLWGLPDDVCEVIEHHHEPNSSSLSGFGVLEAVHVADAILTSLDERRPLHLHREMMRRPGVAEQMGPWTVLAKRMLGIELRAVGT